MLCECTNVPAAMSVAAKPIVTLYLRMGSPFLMARVAILWPDGTWLRQVSPSPSLVPISTFDRAMTTLSAVIFLVSAEYEWATTYIINRVINGDYGVAIAYSSVLIVLMLAAIWLIQRLVGERRLGRREAGVASAHIGELGGSAA